MGAAQFPVILTYHSISEGDPPLQISPSLFAEQMEWLQANVRVASLGEVVDALTERKPLPERTVVLTFDDGYSDFYSSAAPVLRRLKFPATIFVPTGFLRWREYFVPTVWMGQPATAARLGPVSCTREGGIFFRRAQYYPSRSARLVGRRGTA